MFYPLIPGFVAVLLGVSPVAPVQAAPGMPVVSRPAVVRDAAVPAAVAPAPAVPAVTSAPRQAVIVIEAPRRISFEQLRRESFRYPEIGTVGRFVELSTEGPPRFE